LLATLLVGRRVVLGAVQHHHDVRVLLDRTGLAQVREQRSAARRAILAFDGA
jgi:hypothetical protein